MIKEAARSTRSGDEIAKPSIGAMVKIALSTHVRRDVFRDEVRATIGEIFSGRTTIHKIAATVPRADELLRPLALYVKHETKIAIDDEAE